MKNLAIYLFPFISLFSEPVFSQSKDTLISKEKINDDFHLFRSVLEEAHPGLYRYNSRSAIDRAFTAVESKLNHDMKVSDFYRLTLPIISLVKCAHTKYMPEGVAENKYYFNTDNLFPLKLYFSEGKAFVIQAIDTTLKIRPGLEVLSINQKSINEIITDLFKYIPADGNGNTLKYCELNQFFNGYYATFMEAPPSFKVDFKNKNGEVLESVLKSIPISRLKGELLGASEPEKPYSAEYRGKIAILKVSSFWQEDPHLSFKKFLKNSFQEIQNRKAETLIIDVRNNEGGNDRSGELLYAYIAGKEFTYYSYLELTNRKKFSSEGSMSLPKPKWLLRSLIRERDGKYYWTKHKNLGIQKPASFPFKGKVIILINGRSMSVTSEFCAVAFENQRAIFVGEETGGAFQGNNSGAFAIVTLPNTHLTVGIPLVAYYMAVEKQRNPDHGIIPQYKISPSIDDILLENDPVMNFALQKADEK